MSGPNKRLTFNKVFKILMVIYSSQCLCIYPADEKEKAEVVIIIFNLPPWLSFVLITIIISEDQISLSHCLSSVKVKTKVHMVLIG
jgi:hypothetical protein